MNRIRTALLGSALVGLAVQVPAQDEFDWMEISIDKHVVGHQEPYYTAVFDFDGMPVAAERLEEVVLMVPNGTGVRWVNSLGVDDFTFAAEKMDLVSLNEKFPAGLYRIVFFPATLGAMGITVSTSAPAVPIVTSPADGAGNIPLDPVITWSPIDAAASELFLEIETADESMGFQVSLRTDATSFHVPAGLLLPGKTYELTVTANVFVDATPYPSQMPIVGGVNSEIASSRHMTFTTALAP